ncbi:MAG: flagellar assembly protein FlaJ, partial [Halobacteria archaeon]|nr:flagellar assembly protein FlaJ [Halobacteria archaeon]
MLIGILGVAVASLIPVGDYLGFLSFGLPLPLQFAIPITPLIYPGYIIRKEEKRIKKRDRSFPSFIRSLGSSEEVKKTTTTNVLETLSHKDFGAITPQIRNLYKRLNMRVSQEGAWEHFATESHSYLIQKFSEMYERARFMGGDTSKLSVVISKNFSR